MPPRNKRRSNGQASGISNKRRKAEPSPRRQERIAAVVNQVASLFSLFSNASSPASSEMQSPMEEDPMVPQGFNVVPERSAVSYSDSVVPENGSDTVEVQVEVAGSDRSESSDDGGSEQGERIVLDELIQESVVEVGGQEQAEAEHEIQMAQAAPQSPPQAVVQNLAPAPLVQPTSPAQDDDPWIAALDDIAPVATRSGFVTITHNIPRFTSYEIDMMEDLKLPDDVSSIDYPRVGNVQLLKLIDEATKIYDGLDLVEGRFVTVRQLERNKHMRRLRLACRLSLPLGDVEEDKRIRELLFPSKTTFEIVKEIKEKIKEGEAKMSYYWIEPPNHGSLHAYVIERKRLPEIQSKEYFRQICQIVDFCHARGVIIRDLKLRKFVFADARRQTVKLDDLDETAICPEVKSDPDLIDYDNFDVDDDRLCDRHGCPAYVSPEILDLSKKWYSGRASDVWSLGVLLYVLLVGRYPFYDVTPAGLFSKIRQGRIHLSEQDGVRLEARLLIRSMLRRDPRERPAVGEVLAHPWLQPKDYRSSFKVFDSTECVFWKKSADGSSNRVLMNSLARMAAALPPAQEPSPAALAATRPPPQRETSASKVVERINANINGNRHGGGL